MPFFNVCFKLREFEINRRNATISNDKYVGLVAKGQIFKVAYCNGTVKLCAAIRCVVFNLCICNKTVKS